MFKLRISPAAQCCFLWFYSPHQKSGKHNSIDTKLQLFVFASSLIMKLNNMTSKEIKNFRNCLYKIVYINRCVWCIKHRRLWNWRYKSKKQLGTYIIPILDFVYIYFDNVILLEIVIVTQLGYISLQLGIITSIRKDILKFIYNHMVLVIYDLNSNSSF